MMAAVKKFRAACKERVAACITAWDYPTAVLAEKAGMDLILIGDSTGVVSLGLESTVGITLDQLIYHCQAVRRGAKSPLILGDMPFGTYEVSPEQAVESALRLMKEGKVDAVKLEGGREMVPQIAAITKAGIPVIGHIGLIPQRALATLDQEIDSISASAQSRQSFGSTVASAKMVLDDAFALQEAGAVATVLEAVAPEAAQMITDALQIPTIGIGCGSSTSAQIVVQSEVLGYEGCFLQNWHKQYANIGEQSVNALKKYREEVSKKTFPERKHTYEIAPGEDEGIKQLGKQKG